MAEKEGRGGSGGRWGVVRDVSGGEEKVEYRMVNRRGKRGERGEREW
jgi:hypothetical protein